MAFVKQRNLFQDLYMRQIHLWAREKNLTGKGVSIAVIDSGIIRQAELLKGNVAKIPGTSKWRENTTDESDRFVGTHGTEVACLIRMIAPDARIYDLKAVCVAGRTLDHYLIDALYKCMTEIKPDIINISLGKHRQAGCDGTCYIDKVVDLVADSGIIIVASAGNRGQQGPLACPGSARGALTVGGATYKKEKARYVPTVAPVSSWSYREGKPNLVAPSDIPVRVRYTMLMPTWAEITVDEAHLGTSYAAPFLSGGIALLLQKKSKVKDPVRFASDVKAAVVASCDRIKGFPRIAQGNGLVNLPATNTFLKVV